MVCKTRPVSRCEEAASVRLLIDPASDLRREPVGIGAVSMPVPFVIVPAFYQRVQQLKPEDSTRPTVEALQIVVDEP